MTIEEFVETAPPELVKDLLELFDWAGHGAEKAGQVESSAFYYLVADRLRERVSRN